MKRAPSLVRLERGHITAAILMASVTAAVWVIGDVVRGEFVAHDVYILVGYFIFLAAGLTWAAWHHDNTLERDLRASRRSIRATARPKSRLRPSD